MTETAQPPVDAKKTPPPVKVPRKHPPYFYLLLLIVPLLLVLSFTPLKNLFPSKGSASIKLSFNPENIAMNRGQESIVKIMADSLGKEVAFSKIVFSFDPSIVNMEGDIEPNPLLKTVIDKTDPDQANQTGKVVWVVGASPNSDRPSGKFEMGSFKLKGISAGKTELLFDSSNMQIASGDALEMEYKTFPAQISVNK